MGAVDLSQPIDTWRGTGCARREPLGIPQVGEHSRSGALCSCLRQAIPQGNFQRSKCRGVTFAIPLKLLHRSIAGARRNQRYNSGPAA